MINFKIVRKHFSSLSFAVIGAGPAGIYTAKHILAAYENSSVDFYDKIPHPYGLVRTGIAPDHQAMKNVEKDFVKILDNNRVRFLGNVEVGRDIPFDTLRKNYSSIILSYGADSEKNLNLKHEDAFGSFSARNFVQWYNGHVFNARMSPFFTDKFDLQNAHDVIIVGNGNVAVDLARILAKDVDALRNYDIPEAVLEVLSKSKVKNIHIIARRGANHAAFTAKEIKELSKVQNIYVYKDELEISIKNSREELVNLQPAEKRQMTRKLELLNSFNIIEKKSDIPENSGGKNIFLRFFLTPQEIFVDGEGGDKKVKGMSFSRTKLPNIESTNEIETFDAQLIFKSIGYKSIKLFEEIAFDNKSSVLVNKEGIVFDSEMNPCNNIFTTGWVKTGPKGIIDSTLRDSYETADTIFRAVGSDLLEKKTPDYTYITSQIAKAGKVVFTFEDWKKIDAHEVEEGQKKGKLREKIIDFDKMLSFVKH